MKTKLSFIALALLALSTVNSQLSTAFAQGTAFTYQGQLQNNGSPANGSYDLTFAVFTDSNGVNQIGGTLTNTATGITNGLFTVVLDFGQGIFTGTPLWLQIGAETNGGGGFTTLAPLQQLTPAPYAIYSANAGNAATATTATTANNFSGTLSGDVTGTQGATVVSSVGGVTAANVASGANAANAATSANTANTIVRRDGSGNVSAGTITANLGGNATTATTANNFSGTISGDVTGTQGATVVSSVGGVTAANVASGANAANAATSGDFPNTNVKRDASGNFSAGTITAASFQSDGGGDFSAGSGNTAVGGYATVAGGYASTASGNFATVGGGQNNTASGSQATVGGGYHNIANNSQATVAGGYGNTASFDATVAGGYGNTASGGFATVGGGDQNNASGPGATVGGGDNNIAIGQYSTVAGGQENTNTGTGATVGGGEANTASGTDAMVAGGSGNNAIGNYSLAAGKSAAANDNNSFVWGDGSRAAASQGAGSFSVLATGGVWFFTGPYPDGLHLAANGTSWGSPSDRNAKKNFQPVDTKGVLEKLAAIPIQQWNYKWEKDIDVPNIGPMAQDFKAAFYPGRDDKSITTLEFDGVELAAIQGLNQKLNAREAEIQDLKARLEKLEQLMNEKNGGAK